MERLFSNIAYTDMYCAVCEACGSGPRAHRISVRLLLHEGLGVFDPN
jgi:hypothetical protein